MTVCSIWKEVFLQPHQKLHQKCRTFPFCLRADSIRPLGHIVPSSLVCCRSLPCSSPSLCCLLPPQPSFLARLPGLIAALPHPDLASREKPHKVVDPAHTEVEDLPG